MYWNAAALVEARVFVAHPKLYRHKLYTLRNETIVSLHVFLEFPIYLVGK